MLISSTNGYDWTTRVTATNQFYSGLVYGAGRFVLSDVGNTGWQVLYSSTNLVDWDGPFPRNVGWLTTGGLSFGNGLFRVAGRAPVWTAGVYLSPDGLQWTFVPTARTGSRAEWAASIKFAVMVAVGTDCAMPMPKAQPSLRFVAELIETRLFEWEEV